MKQVWQLSLHGLVLFEHEEKFKVMTWGTMYGHITYFRKKHRFEYGVKVQCVEKDQEDSILF